MTRTFEQILEIDSIVANLYKKDENLQNSKFGYAYKKYFAKNYSPALEEFQARIGEIRINNALEDEKTKAIITDPTNNRGFKYSKEGLIKCIAEENQCKKDFYQREIEIIPYISFLIPEGLNDEDKELLTGVVI